MLHHRYHIVWLGLWVKTVYRPIEICISKQIYNVDYLSKMSTQLFQCRTIYKYLSKISTRYNQHM